jgi:hypothetical protein
MNIYYFYYKSMEKTIHSIELDDVLLVLVGLCGAVVVREAVVPLIAIVAEATTLPTELELGSTGTFGLGLPSFLHLPGALILPNCSQKYPTSQLGYSTAPHNSPCFAWVKTRPKRMNLYMKSETEG